MRDGYELIRHIYKISKEDYEKRLDEFIEMLDMKEFINQPVRQLSLGQKMRAEIVATMLHNPKLLFNLIPCSAIMIIVYRNYFIFCINSCSLCVFFLSIILGFMVLWEISSIVQMLCFWIVNVWSISTIKDVFINVLAGTILPVWYLPEAIQNIIKYTPFAAIYITPLKIYLNQMGTKQQIEALLMQLIWIIILALFGNLLWHMGKKKLVVQGG